jgi:protein-tyrosine-phosphatase
MAELRVLFVSIEGAVRAPIAAAAMNACKGGEFRAFSAGTRPAAEIPGATIDALRIAGIPATGIKAAGLADFQLPEAPRLDFVFNLTEPYEMCGAITLPGTPVIVSWPIPHPVMESGSPAERGSRLAETVRMIRRRVELFAELPGDRLDALAMRLQAESIHRQVGA